MKRNTTMLALGTLVALAAVGTAGAATTAAQPAATQATCDALMKQAGNALTTHKGDAKAKSAQEQRDKGEKECKAGNYTAGAEHLRHAITDLGMKPVN
jgi:predicted lipoprotein with Yx(FWY)xxD motif